MHGGTDAATCSELARGGFGAQVIWRDVVLGPCGHASGDQTIEMTRAGR